MKKNIAVLLSVCLLVSLLLLPSGAMEKGSWYCAHAKDHRRPALDPAFSYIEKYDGYYLGPDEKVLYLTFDAGYENGNVEKILDVLKEKQVPAAFFVLSHLILSETDLVKRMFDEGHLVCNHTSRHKDMSAVDRATFERELKALERVCLENTGHEVAKFYRPPEGKFSEESLAWAQELGYRTVFWSFAYADWDNKGQMSPSAAKEKILSNLHPGEILLLHPTSATNAAVLGEVIDQCVAQGYRFASLCELSDV